MSTDDDRCLRCGYEHSTGRPCIGMGEADEMSWREEVLQRHRRHKIVYYERIDQSRRITVCDGLIVTLGRKLDLNVDSSSIHCETCDEELIADNDGALIQARIEP